MYSPYYEDIYVKPDTSYGCGFSSLTDTKMNDVVFNDKRTGGRIHRNKIRRLALFQENRCFYCQQEMLFLDPRLHYEGDDGNGDLYASEEHVVPKSLGGSNHLYNIVIAHRACNSKKRSEVPDGETLCRLENLNRLRGVAAPNVPGTLHPTMMGQPTRAFTYLCDLANAVEGSNGTRLRRAIASRLGDLPLYAKALQGVNDVGFLGRMLTLLLVDDVKHRQPLGEPYDSLIRNVLMTYRKEILRKAKIKPVEENSGPQ